MLVTWLVTCIVTDVEGNEFTKYRHEVAESITAAIKLAHLNVHGIVRVVSVTEDWIG